jgi:hypothetical protein
VPEASAVSCTACLQMQQECPLVLVLLLLLLYDLDFLQL